MAAAYNASVGRGILYFVLLIAAGCSSPTRGSAKVTPMSGGSFLGKWVCLADNVNTNPQATMEFRTDGTVEFREALKEPIVMRYRGEPGTQWFARRKKELKAC